VISTFYIFLAITALLVAVFGWSLRVLGKQSRTLIDPVELEDSPRQQVSYFAQIQQALKDQDLIYIRARASRKLARQVQAERLDIALLYLGAVHEDFQKLLRLARVIAVLSPEVAALQEFERLRLVVEFSLRYRLACLSLTLGHAPLLMLANLCDVVSGLSVKVEGAISVLGRNAASSGERTNLRPV
jgi:hypothetical protein